MESRWYKYRSEDTIGPEGRGGEAKTKDRRRRSLSSEKIEQRRRLHVGCLTIETTRAPKGRCVPQTKCHKQSFMS